MAACARRDVVRIFAIIALLRSTISWGCTCIDVHGSWPTGRRGVPRTVHPLIHARPGAEYSLFDLGPVPDRPDAISKLRVELDMPEAGSKGIEGVWHLQGARGTPVGKNVGFPVR